MAPPLSEVEEKALRELMKIIKKNLTAKEPKPISRDDVIWILDRVAPIFNEQPMLAEANAPITLCGDIHGQFADLIRLFDQNGWPGKTRYMFLGDYVDRGPMSFEVITLLLALKVRHSTSLYLLRGNHETRSVNKRYGFAKEITRRYDNSLYEQFNTVFDVMPVAGLVAERILCMHGGLSPNLISLDQIRNLTRPLTQIRGLVADLLWADPDKDVNGFVPSSRGISFEFGSDVVNELCEILDLDLIARAHQVVPEGFEFFAKRRLITLFTAPDYCGQFRNSGGILCVDDNLNCKIRQLPSKTRRQ